VGCAEKFSAKWGGANIEEHGLALTIDERCEWVGFLIENLDSNLPAVSGSPAAGFLDDEAAPFLQ